MKRNKTKPDKHTGLGKILGAHILKRELQGILQSTIPVLWGPFSESCLSSQLLRGQVLRNFPHSSQLKKNFITVGS